MQHVAIIHGFFWAPVAHRKQGDWALSGLHAFFFLLFSQPAERERVIGNRPIHTCHPTSVRLKNTARE